MLPFGTTRPPVNFAKERILAKRMKQRGYRPLTGIVSISRVAPRQSSSEFVLPHSLRDMDVWNEVKEERWQVLDDGAGDAIHSSTTPPRILDHDCLRFWNNARMQRVSTVL